MMKGGKSKDLGNLKKHVKSNEETKRSGESKERKNSKHSSKEEITAYFLRSPKNDPYALPDISGLPEVSVPSPDDAALPKSSSLCSTVPDESKGKLSKKTIQGKQNIENVSMKHSGVQGDKLLNTITTEEEDDVKSQDFKCCKIINGSGPYAKKKTKKIDREVKSRPLTDFYPVRRSGRKTLCTVMKEKQKEVEEAILSGKEEGFEVKEFIGKGRGVIANRLFKRGDFVLEYYGELIDVEEAKKRENIYATNEDTGCYMYYFTYKNKQYCIDATKESGRLGRLVNHSKKGNLKTQPFFIQDTPHLILIAHRDIAPGEELLYDYGDRSKKSLESHPWLAL